MIGHKVLFRLDLFIRWKTHVIAEPICTDHAEKQKRNDDVVVVMRKPGRENKSTHRCCSEETYDWILSVRHHKGKSTPTLADALKARRINVYTPCWMPGRRWIADPGWNCSSKLHHKTDCQVQNHEIQWASDSQIRPILKPYSAVTRTQNAI